MRKDADDNDRKSLLEPSAGKGESKIIYMYYQEFAPKLRFDTTTTTYPFHTTRDKVYALIKIKILDSPPPRRKLLVLTFHLKHLINFPDGYSFH